MPTVVSHSIGVDEKYPAGLEVRSSLWLFGQKSTDKLSSGVAPFRGCQVARKNLT
jgi:hypothetical protein